MRPPSRSPTPPRSDSSGRDPDGWLDPARPDARAALHAWWSLQRVAALQPERACARLADGADPGSVRAALEGSRPPRPLPAPGSAAFGALCDRMARLGARALPWGAPGYPERLGVLCDAPPLLWVRGDPAALRAPAVAVVGARRATAYGREVARSLSTSLAAAGVPVLSGLARGVDAAAHRGALEAGGRTAAVLGCGPDRIYPPDHEALADAMRVRGALVSEFAPGAPPLPHHFPLRNRILSALSDAVVVVEARLRSGSLVTARHALDQGREVLVVPGPIDAPASRGSNRLLRDGAAPVLEVDDVLHAIGWSDPAVPAPDPEAEGGGALARALRSEPGTRDELARRLGWSAATLARELLALELSGRIAEEPDGRIRWVGPVRRAGDPGLC